MSDLTDWPKGFFDQQEKDIRELIEAKRKKNAR
jgi:predicted ATPase